MPLAGTGRDQADGAMFWFKPEEVGRVVVITLRGVQGSRVLHAFRYGCACR